MRSYLFELIDISEAKAKKIHFIPRVGTPHPGHKRRKIKRSNHYIPPHNATVRQMETTLPTSPAIFFQGFNAYRLFSVIRHHSADCRSLAAIFNPPVPLNCDCPARMSSDLCPAAVFALATGGSRTGLYSAPCKNTPGRKQGRASAVRAPFFRERMDSGTTALSTMTEARATRNPMLLFLLSGLFLLRFADRAFLALLFQLPPRLTRPAVSLSPLKRNLL